MAMTPEGRIKAKLDRMLKEEGAWFFSPQAGPYGRSGIPDRIGCVLGRMFAVECKADRTKKPTRLQQQAMEQLAGAGAVVFLVYDEAGVDNVRTWVRAQKVMNARS
jgi:hypothetical protein